jgi:hypothetical protein
MDREQAKEVLLRYRPGTDATVDPQVVEALRLLDEDLDLAQWFAQQQKADNAIRAGLRATPVPADLKERILAEQKIVRVDFGRRRRILAAAAAIVVIAAITEWAMLRPGINNAFDAYRKYTVAYIADSYIVTLKANNFDELRQALAQRKWPTDFIVPESLRAATVVGGGAFEWNGHKVSLACLKEENHGAWLFVVDNATFRDPPTSKIPQVQMVDATPTAVWTQDGKTYLFTTQGDEAFLKKYLPQTVAD